MLITIKRIYYRTGFTLGALQIQMNCNPEYSEQKYFCDTLEPHAIDWSKEKKIPGKTAIPAGRYKVVLRKSMVFKKMMPFLEDVPHFKGIMLHPGNSPEDTRGCLLVGVAARPTNDEMDNANPMEVPNEELTDKATVIGWLTDSRTTFKKLYELIEEAVGCGEEVWVEVR